MLLRLLPAPTPAQQTPPTILFTLPLPANPYTYVAYPPLSSPRNRTRLSVGHTITS